MAPPNNEMKLTRSAMARWTRPSQLISVFDGPCGTRYDSPGEAEE
jgi:hypothetical protein